MADGHTGMRVPVQLRDELQAVALTMSAEVGRRLSLSDIVRADRAVASRHADELRAELTTPKQQQEGTDR